MVENTSKYGCVDYDIVKGYISECEKALIGDTQNGDHNIFSTIPPLITYILFPYYHVNDNQTYYKLLGLKPNASRNEIKRAYRRFCRQLNVSKIFNRRKENLIEYKLKKLSKAYNILMNPTKRKLYDQFSL